MAQKSFMGLLNDYTIEIPIIQRDYVQGRKDKHAQVVCDNLLNDIFSAIEGNTLNLNFVYGKLQNDRFVPVDGQQRLTTLFLLNIFAFRNDDTKTSLLSKFTYETRISSREFFKRIVEKRKIVFSSERFRDFILDAEWFINGWEFDPTVQSAIAVFEKIVTIFGGIEEEKLKSALIGNKVVFEFLEMEKLGMEDSLYIKLNARGKMLTQYENFKAILSHQMIVLKYQNRKDFEINIDGKWLDYFWDKYKENTDDVLLKLLRNVLVNYDYVSYSEKNFNVSSKWYKKIDKNFFDILKYTFDFLCDENISDEYKSIITCVGEIDSSNEHFALLHAVTQYLYNNEGLVEEKDFFQWFRVLKNLIKNSLTDKEDTFQKVILGINNLSTHTKDLLEFISKNEVFVFDKEQFKEEQVKANIILGGNEKFNDQIYHAEKQPYFRGQIRCGLYISMDENNNYCSDIFVRNWKIIEDIFNDKGPKDGLSLRRALLSIGDYTTSAGRTEDLMTFFPDYNSVQAKTPSIMKLFSQNSSIVRTLINELLSGKNYEEIITSYVIDSNDWRFCMIYYPHLFKTMSETHLRFCQSPLYSDDNYFLIPNKQPKGRIYEVHLCVLEYELNIIKPGMVHFDENHGRYNDHFLYDFNGNIITFGWDVFEVQSKDSHVEKFIINKDTDWKQLAKSIYETINR